MFSDIGAGFKSMVGGEIKAMTKLTKDLRNELVSISLTSGQLFKKLDILYRAGLTMRQTRHSF